MNKAPLTDVSGYLITDFFKARHCKKVTQSNVENCSPDVEAVVDLTPLEQSKFSLKEHIQASFPDYIIRVLGLKNMLNFSPITIHMKHQSDDQTVPKIVLHTDDLIDVCQFDWDFQNRPYICLKMCDPDTSKEGVLTLTRHQNNEWNYCWAKKPCIFSPFDFKESHIPLANCLIDPKISSEEKEGILRSLLFRAEKTHDVSHVSPSPF